MSRLASFLVLPLFMNATVVHAEAKLIAPKNSPSIIEKIPVKKIFQNTPFVDLYSGEGLKKKSTPVSDLSQLKIYEIQLKWESCLSLAPKVFAKHKDLRGWVGLTWLHCLNKEYPKDSKLNSEKSRVIENAMKTFGSHSTLLRDGPWAADLRQAWLSQKWNLLEALVQSKSPKAESELAQLLQPEMELTKEQKSKIFEWLGDLALIRKELNQGRFFYDESLSLKDSKEVARKLESLVKEKKQPEVASEFLSHAKKKENSIEDQWDEKIANQLEQKINSQTSVDLIKDIVKLLNQFPGGRAARRYKDKPMDLYSTLTEAALVTKALHELQEADPARQLDWAQTLHRKQDYAGALVLAQKAFELSPHSTSVVNHLWIAGRSAHFLGRYPEALVFFSKLIEMGKGSEEAAEALFRTGLIQFRQKDFNQAISSFEKLLQLGKDQGRDRYELSSQYWIVRCFEQTNKEQALTLAQALVARYPFSYYGLRLNTEAHEGQWLWPEQAEKDVYLDQDIFLVGSQKASWKRFISLSKAGWVVEAHQEFQEGPMIRDPETKVALAGELAAHHQYFLAIRMINEAMEIAPSLRRAEFLKLGYPEIFETLYKKEATKYHIEINLLRSLTRQESGFNMRAVSTSKAMGLMQMIPPTAQEIAKKLNLKIEIPEDMFRPEINIPMGSFYVAQMIEQFHGNVPFSLAAYNAGPHRIKTWAEGRPEVKALVEKNSSRPEDELWFDELPWNETSLYVKAILRNLMIYKALAQP